jgi:hypothetical protein
MKRYRDPHTDVVGLTVPGAGTSRTIRAGDDDRRHAMDQLQAHYVAGRLTSEELEGRFERTLAARTLADLDVLLADLPSTETASAEQPFGDDRWSRRRPRRGKVGKQAFRAHATSYLLVIGMLVAIWLLTTPGGYFWPIWPMLGWGIGLASHGLATRGGAGWHGCRETRLAA